MISEFGIGIIVVFIFVEIVIFINFIIKTIFNFFKKRGTKQHSQPLKQVPEVGTNTLSPGIKEELEGDKNSIEYHTPFDLPSSTFNEEREIENKKREEIDNKLKEEKYKDLTKEVKK